MAAHFVDALLGAIFGGIVSIALTIWVERLRGPRVRIVINDPVQFLPRGPFGNNWWSLRVKVSNERLNCWANWWMVRSPAQQCRAEISFLRIDGTPFFDKPMTGRWTDSPEPKVVSVQTQNGIVAVLNNPQELKAAVDIYPDDAELLDVAVRVDHELEAYGWNSETYFHQTWRNPDRQFNRGLYIAEITIASSGRKRRAWFRLENDGPFNTFRLGELTEAQQQAVRHRRLG
jgi:hypothetical protein